MKNPRTVYEVLQMLEDYHATRKTTYEKLASESTDSMAQILLEQLVELETHSLEVLRIEMKQLGAKQSSYLTSGPVIGREATHAKDCRCESDPSFLDTLGCAVTSDNLLGQLLHRLEGCSAAPSVLDLAARLRDLEETKSVQISKFTRMD